MDNYFTDYESLGRIVDQLIAQKFPNQPPENFASLREESIQKLDNQIGDVIIGSLTREQLDEFNALLDQEDADASVFQQFFEKHSIDLNNIITHTVKDFQDSFMGGEND